MMSPTADGQRGTGLHPLSQRRGPASDTERKSQRTSASAQSPRQPRAIPTPATPKSRTPPTNPNRNMFRSPNPLRLRIRNKRGAFSYKRFGGSKLGRLGTKATGGLAKGIGFGTSVILLDAGIRGASKAINVGEVEEIDSDQSHSNGLVVVHNKGDNEGSPITTYVMAATTIILLIMMGPCLFKRLKRFRSKGKETTYPDPAKTPFPPGNLPIPR